MDKLGWADVATKRDLDQLEERINQRFEGVDQRFDGLAQTVRTALAEQNAAIQTDLRKMQGMLLSAMVAQATLVAAIVTITS